MMKIRLFCITGMLSSLLVNKMMDAAKLKELDIDIQIISESQMSKALVGVSVVLLGPQSAYKLSKVNLICEPLGIATSVIPMIEFGRMDGNKILDIALNSIKEMKRKLEREVTKKEEQQEIKREIANRSVVKSEDEKLEIKAKMDVPQLNRKLQLDTYELVVSGVEKNEEVYNEINKDESRDYKIDGILNLKENYNMIGESKELILSAEKEIYISTNIDISIFKDEIIQISQRGVRLTVVSFKEYHGEELPIDKLYTYLGEKNKKEIIMIVVDDNKALVADNNFGDDENSNVVTNNPLLISVISKNIRNKIYLLKLRDNIAFELNDV